MSVSRLDQATATTRSVTTNTLTAESTKSLATKPADKPWVEPVRQGVLATVLLDGFLVSTPRGRGGALIAGVLETVRSVEKNGEAVRTGRLTGAEGALNVMGDTAIAASGGATGALIGGWVGSAIPIPVVGTLVGAYLGAQLGSFVADNLHERLDPIFHVEQHAESQA